MKNESDFSLTNPELRALTTALKERWTSLGRSHILWAAEEDLLSERLVGLGQQGEREWPWALLEMVANEQGAQM